MKPLPMPLRIAAGLVATAVEQARELPRKLVELPVTAVSQALQVSMRMQQRVTELAIKGDRALGALRPVPETPTWARFDEDGDFAPRPANGLVSVPGAADAPTPRQVTPVHVVPEPESGSGSEVPAPRGPAPAEHSVAEHSVAEHSAAEHSAAGDAPSGPPGLPEYEQWSLPQLRARFRRLTAEQLRALLAWETAHQNRPPFVTMLGNRIASVTGR